MILIHKSKYEKNFTLVPNSIFEDKDLSLKATAILIYAISKPLDWKLRVSDIINHFAEGRDAVYSGIKELENKNYFIRVQEQSRSSGRFTEVVYHVYDSPRTGKKVTKPLTENPETVPLTENPTHSNTNINNNNILTKKEGGVSALSDGSFKRELSKQFGLNPTAVQFELDSMIDWLKSKGETRKDYKAFARNWIRKGVARDLPLKREEPVNLLNKKYGTK